MNDATCHWHTFTTIARNENPKKRRKYSIQLYRFRNIEILFWYVICRYPNCYSIHFGGSCKFSKFQILMSFAANKTKFGKTVFPHYHNRFILFFSVVRNKFSFLCENSLFHLLLWLTTILSILFGIFCFRSN